MYSVSNKMNPTANFDLALANLRSTLSDTAYSYLLGVFEERQTRSPFNDKSELEPDNKKPNLLTPLREGRTTAIPGAHINLSSLKLTRGSSLESEVLCSRLPACKRILIKGSGKTTIGDSKPSSSVHLKRRDSSIAAGISVFQPLIGKIAYPEHGSIISTKTAATKSIPEKGVCEMYQSISNPLYKNYDPRGYIKSEDELGKELLVEISNKFNSWLESLAGEKVEIDPGLLIRILRTDLEVPDPIELRNITRFIELA